MANGSCRLQTYIISRSRLCDSANLNLSPLCNLSRRSNPAKWGMDVKSLYPTNNMPEYVTAIPQSLRDNYDTEEGKRAELLQTLTKVRLGSHCYYLLFTIYFLRRILATMLSKEISRWSTYSSENQLL